MRAAALAAALALAAPAWGELEPRAKAEEYPAHAKAGRLEIGAEFDFRTVTRGRDWFFLQDAIVVEVGIFGPIGEAATVSPAQFTLRINGKGPALTPLPPGVVISQEKWGRRPSLTVAAQGGRVVFGGPEAAPRFPGDPRGPRTDPRPKPPEQKPGAEPAPPQVSPARFLEEAALPSGKRALPVAGYLYFPYKGKIKKIKKLELYYQGPKAGAVIRLR